MNNRRMFSNRIANSARFLQMPAETQLLYFHMVLRADDDGVVESYPLIKLLGLAPDNFKVLIAKGFVEILNDDQVVVIIEWLEHNKIRADRKVDSIYKPLLEARGIETIAPKPRSDVDDNSKRLGGQSTDGISKVKLSKVKLNNIIEKDEKTSLIVFGEFKNVKLSEEEYKKLVERLGKSVADDLVEELAGYIASTNKRYASHYATLLNWARRKTNEKNYKKKNITII
jgi:hypothetical protein